jgi:hypothetical protein
MRTGIVEDDRSSSGGIELGAGDGLDRQKERVPSRGRAT